LSGPFDDRPNIARMVATMEKNGWLRRHVDADDARFLRVSLTPAGERVVQRLRAAALEERKRLFAGLTKADLEELKRITGVISRNLEGPPVGDDRRDGKGS
jgi:DNA-binding MarR family transcriptional regulator